MIKKRMELIKTLNELKCAVTENETIEQSNAFVFQNKKIFSFNGEILAAVDYDIGVQKDFAVPGSKLLRILEKFPDDEISIELKGNELFIQGKNKRAGIAIFEEILLPFNEVPKPKQMKKTKEEFFHSLLQCARVCGKNHTDPRTTHVHVSSNLIEATDSYRVFRVDIKTGFTNDFMIPADAILSIGNKNIIIHENTLIQPTTNF